MIRALKRIYKRYTNNVAFTKSVEEQKEFLHQFKGDLSAQERVYAKYLCRKYMSPSKTDFFVLNTVSFLAFVPVWVYYKLSAVNRSVAKNDNKRIALIRKDRFFEKIEDIVPEQIYELYNNVQYIELKDYKNSWLDKEAAGLLKQLIKRHPFSFYMNFMTMLNLADCCKTISLYHPAAIVSYAEERNFAKPLVTELCHMKGVICDAFMHGECFYQVDKGLFYYDTYYVWDEFYSQLFNELNCKCNYKIYTPDRLYHELTPIYTYKDTETFLTYYLGDESVETLGRIKVFLSKLIDVGLKCKVRPHPRFGDHEKVKELFGPLIESCNIDESLERTYCVAALCSTVQEEAYYSGRAVVCDDWSNEKRFRDIEEKGYALLEKPHYRVSELMKHLDDGSLLVYLENSGSKIRGGLS